MVVSSNASGTFNLLAQVISIKLDGTNFLAWSAQIIPFFWSYGLIGIVDDSNSCLSQYSSDELCDQGVFNSAYVVWQYKDQTVLGWIVLSLFPSIVSTIYGLAACLEGLQFAFCCTFHFLNFSHQEKTSVSSTRLHVVPKFSG